MLLQMFFSLQKDAFLLSFFYNFNLKKKLTVLNRLKVEQNHGQIENISSRKVESFCEVCNVRHW